MAKKSKALILAVNAYESVSPLRGCLNDARDVNGLLTGIYGFPGDSVKVLTDKDVRKARIRPMLTWLFEDMGPGDRVALHFSGHGSRVADLEGEETRDGLDEVLCLHDMDFDRPASYLVDDEIARWTKRCPAGVLLSVFLDCCHSGTGTRKLIPPVKTKPSLMYPRIVESTTARRTAEHRFGASRLAAGSVSLEVMTELARGLSEASPQEQVLARYVDPPDPVQIKVQRALESRPRSSHDTIEVVDGMNHLLLAACQDDQTAADAYIEGEYRGAFSYYLCKIHREAGRELDRNELISRLARCLDENHYQQIPRLEAARPHGTIFSAGEEGPPSDPSSGPPEEPAVSDGSNASEPELPGEGREVDGSEVYRELIATFNRLLDLIQPGMAGVVAPPRAAGPLPKQIVYVHGIGRHTPGYSDRWWDALSPHTPSLRPGILGVQRHEVLWSDLVNRSVADAGQREAENAEARQLTRQIREQLEDRVDQAIEGRRELSQSRGEPFGPDTLDPDTLARDLERGLFDGLDDFSRYMTDERVRRDILARFLQVLRPRLRQGGPVEVITHSWGTVVAFEGLRQMDADPTIPVGSVHSFFTVGSALSIPAVRWNLSGRVPDGRKPRAVARWINIDASGDVVGGPIQSKGFGVDIERLGLPAVGCGLLSPVCAHGSYFVSANLAVNRDLFAASIERP